MEDLTPAQLLELASILRQSCADLEQLIESSGESSKPVALDQPIGRLSRMDALQHQHMALANRQAQIQRLQLLRNAQKAMKRGSYGLCRRCEEPISYQRLMAQPESAFCLDCQSRTEKN